MHVGRLGFPVRRVPRLFLGKAALAVLSQTVRLRRVREILLGTFQLPAREAHFLGGHPKPLSSPQRYDHRALRPGPHRPLLLRPPRHVRPRLVILRDARPADLLQTGAVAWFQPEEGPVFDLVAARAVGLAADNARRKASSRPGELPGAPAAPVVVAVGARALRLELPQATDFQAHAAALLVLGGLDRHL